MVAAIAATAEALWSPLFEAHDMTGYRCSVVKALSVAKFCPCIDLDFNIEDKKL